MSLKATPYCYGKGVAFSATGFISVSAPCESDSRDTLGRLIHRGLLK